MDHPFAQHTQEEDGVVDTMLSPEDPNDRDDVEPPPPPYESVVMSNEEPRGPELRSSQQATPSQPKFDIRVADPLKQGEGVGAYTSYRVCTTTDAEQYRTKQPEVIRRYRDFCWLHERLTEQHRGIIIPPIPEKNVVQKYQMNQEFVSVRKQALQVFINRVAKHPALWSSSALQLFLEASEGDFQLEVARGNHEAGGGAKKKLASTLQLFRDLGQSTANLVASGRNSDEDEDMDYLKVRDYMAALEGHLAEVHKQAQRLLKRQAELGLALQDFGASLACLSAFDSAPLDQAFQGLADRASAAASLSQKQSDELINDFEAPLKEAVRAVKACQAVMSDRAHALQAVQSAKADQEARRTKLNKLRGIPGIKAEKVAEAEHEVFTAGTCKENAQAAYEIIVRRMSQELARFQKERAEETLKLLQNFARSQAALAGEHSKLWCSLLEKAPKTANGHH